MRGAVVASFVLVLGCEDPAPGGTDGGTLGDGALVDGTPVAGSTGCGMPANIASGQWVKRTIDSGGPRDLWVWLPTGYDPSRAYPIIYQLHGCSTSATREANNVPVERQVGADAITVRGRAAANCWDTSATGPDLPYFDAMLADVEGAFCVDTARRFVTGYSSGAFMSHRVACVRGDKLRGVATIAGGQPGTNCTGNVAALLIHDRNDTTVNISQSEAARDNHLMRNTCGTTTMPTAQSPCVAYDGCAAGKPVVWCETTGKNHDRQDMLAAPIFWTFISSSF